MAARTKAVVVEEGVKYFAQLIGVKYRNKRKPSLVPEENEVIRNLRTLLLEADMQQAREFAGDLGILLEIREDG